MDYSLKIGMTDRGKTSGKYQCKKDWIIVVVGV